MTHTHAHTPTPTYTPQTHRGAFRSNLTSSKDCEAHDEKKLLIFGMFCSIWSWKKEKEGGGGGESGGRGPIDAFRFWSIFNLGEKVGGMPWREAAKGWPSRLTWRLRN